MTAGRRADDGSSPAVAPLVAVPIATEMPDRLTRVELQQQVHNDQITVLQHALTTLTDGVQKLNFRIAIGLVVIFSGTANGGEVLRWAVGLLTH